MRSSVRAMFTRGQKAMFSTEGLKVQHSPKTSEFHVDLDNHKAFVQYDRQGNVLDIVHTVVPEVSSEN